jgi:hypothetical protein
MIFDDFSKNKFLTENKYSKNPTVIHVVVSSFATTLSIHPATTTTTASNRSKWRLSESSEESGEK